MRHRWLRVCCWVLWLPIVAGLHFACGISAEDEFNVLLVTLDTTRADYLGCYGGAMANTPVIDALAADGVRFELAISPSANTPSSPPRS